MAGYVQLSVAPRRRGVFKYRQRIMGRNAYGARMASGDLLNGALYVVTDEMGDAELVAWLRDELNRAEPRHLRLERRTVAPSIDGPSHQHPTLARVEEARRAETPILVLPPAAAIAAELAERYADDDIMRDVCRHLSQLLSESA